MIVGTTAIRVRCTNDVCREPANATVDLPLLVKGVIGRPTLICAACGWELMEDWNATA